ncbi:ComEC/Rec2 family competence protein [Bradyrhizobium sp. SZCCHNS3053]|uniref:ComEC/Rec2 family competence protein n=1 Tax=Bradyrhizobium sp. SZCCHNS3053 TaxID=3057322 RepID=UPI0029167161|nr:MBL fold metallo-hydrolase [Bradyrhizobium sp. SZCCHNS3053]
MSATAGVGVTEITLFRASDGDCILVRCVDGSENFNMLVDAGRTSTVARLKKFMQKLSDGERRVDLFVVTHIDADHIAGAIALAEDATLAPMVKAVWFNAAKHLPQDTLPMSVGQGKTFADLIDKNGWAWNKETDGEAIVRKPGMTPINLGEASTVTAHLLGPLPSGLAALAEIWPLPEVRAGDEEPSEVAMGIEPPPDVEALAAADYTADDTVPNQSSIAFVLGHGNRRILIAADSHAETLVASVDEDFGGRLEVDVATLPHHGSRRNTSPKLAERIVASTWTVSTQGGGKHLFPHGESIARILTRKESDNRLRFVFNSEHRETWRWNDVGTKKAYGYSTQYPDEDDEWITLSI